jgi:hypothetical protein
MATINGEIEFGEATGAAIARRRVTYLHRSFLKVGCDTSRQYRGLWSETRGNDTE